MVSAATSQKESLEKKTLQGITISLGHELCDDLVDHVLWDGLSYLLQVQLAATSSVLSPLVESEF